MNLKTKIIGIDPDIDKSGVCYLYSPTRQIEVKSLAFPELLEYLSEFEYDCNVIVVIEASWKTKHNWHGKWGDNRNIMAAKGYDVGRNHQTGQLVVEMCRHWKIPVWEKMPLKKIWRSRDGKITQEEIEQFVPHFPKRSNQEVRDATLLAWDYAGFPIRVKPVKTGLI